MVYQGYKLEKPARLKRGQLDIYIDFKPGSRFKDEHGLLSGAYDTEERTWQHLNFFEHTCYLHARVPRIKQSSGEIRTVVVPWARPGSGFTLLFEAFAMLLIGKPTTKYLLIYPRPFPTFAGTRCGAATPLYD
jgi:hypothetical protein